MRKLVLGLAVSLDGFIEGPNGEYDWCFMDPEYNMNEFLKRFDSIFVGRKTYQMSEGMEGGPPGFPKYKEYVFSTTLERVKPDAILIKNEIKTEVEKIKNQTGKDIWLFGGAGLATSLMNLQLVDELSLAVYPILLGGGKPLFNSLKQRTNLQLLHSKSYTSGLLALRYSLVKK